MEIIVGTHELFDEHETGLGHPESPERVEAALAGITTALAGSADAELEDVARTFVPRPATRQELERVHDPGYLLYLEERCLVGGGALDADTHVSPGSFDAALHAAGAGPDAAERLGRGEADAAFLVLRPPGHHALAARAMGFCLLNNVAITAAALAARGERVLVVDWDAHHGNGTQAAFYDSDDVLFVSLHEYPLYPGTGALEEIGSGRGTGSTVNVPFPAGTSGDAYRLAVDELIVPAAERFSPSWLLVSAGFDAHRADPLTDLGLTAGDFADLAERVAQLVPPGRRLFFLEGGYDLEALAASVGATVAALVGRTFRPERASGAGLDGSLGAGEGSRPRAVVQAARQLHERSAEG